MRHAVIDIETLGTGVTSKVLSIGATFFDEDEAAGDALILHRRFAVQLDVDLQPDRTMDISTIQWWIEQELEARVASWYGMLTVDEAMRELAEWSNEHDLSEARWWARGPHFDIAILDTLFEQTPWGYNKVRDSRTLFDASGQNERDVLEAAWDRNNALWRHIAEDDAAVEAMGIKKVLGDIRSAVELRDGILETTKNMTDELDRRVESMGCLDRPVVESMFIVGDEVYWPTERPTDTLTITMIDGAFCDLVNQNICAYARVRLSDLIKKDSFGFT